MMDNNTTIVLLPQRPDAESEAILGLCRRAGVPTAVCWDEIALAKADRILACEREDWPSWAVGHPAVILVDHHAPGDPGYGRPPAEYLAASSIGQVLRWLGMQADDGIRMVAAADHCLAAAYRGECPGVDRVAFARYRVESRAAFQRRPAADVEADILRSMAALRAAPLLDLGGCTASDMRPGRGAPCAAHGDVCAGDAMACWADLPELPDAAALLGTAFIGSPKPNPREPGRRKIVLQVAGEEHLKAWPQWAEANGITDLYGGDAMRGFAGGYHA